MKIAQNSQAVCAMHRYEKTFIIKIQEKAGYEYEKCNNSRPPVDSAQDLALRNKNTGTNEFRSLTDEIAMLMGYEGASRSSAGRSGSRNLIEICSTPMLAGKKLAVVPILRAGLGMVNGILALVPSANSWSHRTLPRRDNP
ncbi:MAG: uracil phosphoribosyltransferase [Clostridium fessum]